MTSKHNVVSSGTVIVAEGERNRTVYTVCKGWAVRSHRLRNGARQILDVLLPGDSIGLASIVVGRSEHAVETLTATTICSMSARHVIGLLKNDASLAFGVLQSCLEQERRADARLTMLGRMTSEAKIGYLMMDIYDRLLGRGLADATGCPFPLRRTDLADAVGLSKVHVLRALRTLRAEQLMQIDGRRLIIPNVARLAAYVGYMPP